MSFAALRLQAFASRRQSTSTYSRVMNGHYNDRCQGWNPVTFLGNTPFSFPGLHPSFERPLEPVRSDPPGLPMRKIGRCARAGALLHALLHLSEPCWSTLLWGCSRHDVDHHPHMSRYSPALDPTRCSRPFSGGSFFSSRRLLFLHLRSRFLTGSDRNMHPRNHAPSHMSTTYTPSMAAVLSIRTHSPFGHCCS